MGAGATGEEQQETEGVHDFPLKPREALMLHLMNSCYYHVGKTLDETKALLTKDGDYLIQSHNSSCLLLSTLVDETVMELQIDITQTSVLSPFRFAIRGCKEFATLDELVHSFSAGGNHFECGGHQFRLIRPICRTEFAGRFGYGEQMRIRDAANRKRSHTSFVRSLRKEFVALPEVEEKTLERLLSLDHRNLVKLRDFFRFDMAAGVHPLITVRYDFYATNLFHHLYELKGPLNTRRYVKWSYQVGKALDYLASNDLLHRRLHPRACLLDNQKRIKLSDYWTRDDVDDAPLYQQTSLLPGAIDESRTMHLDGWRYLPVETLLTGTFDLSSQVWSYALLMWQLFTHVQFTNRSFFTRLSEFLAVGATDDAFYMPGHLTRSEANAGLPEERRRKILFHKMSDQFPRAPDSLAQLVPRCLERDPAERPSLGELFRVVENEHRIHKLSKFLSNFM